MRRLVWLIAVLALLVPRVAFARIALHLEDGARGPAVLTESHGTFTGSFVIENQGDQPLGISRVAIREDDAVHVVRGLSVKSDVKTIAPGEHAKVTVEWKPDLSRAPPELFAHVVVTSNDESSGEVAMGVTAASSGTLGPLEHRLLSLIVFLPFAGALLALGIALVFPQGQARVMRAIALVATFGQLALVLMAVRRFAPDFTRAMGNDGLQLIERSIWIRPLGIEWFVALDGHAVLLLVFVSLVSALGALASRVEKHVEGYFGLYLATAGAASCAAVAHDLALFVVSLAIAAIGASLLSSFGARQTKSAMGAFMIGALVLVVLCVLAIRSGSARTFLVDGSTTAHTFATTELERVAFTRTAGSILGVPIGEVAVVLGLAGFGILAGMFPLHVWMPHAASEVPAPGALMAIAVVPRLGMIGLLRVLFGILPEGTRWAGATITAMGVATLVYAGVCALAETDLMKAAARFASAHAGLVLIGVGSTTPQGLAGASSVMLSGGIAIALLILCAGVIESRTNERDVSRLGGLIREMPFFSVLGIAGLIGCAAIPPSASFWSLLLVLMGALPVHPVLTGGAALGVLLVGAAALRLVSQVFFGTIPEHWRKSPVLEPLGGKFPDLRLAEPWTLGALALLVIVLGVWPNPMLSVLAGAIRDAVARANLGPMQLGF